MRQLLPGLFEIDTIKVQAELDITLRRVAHGVLGKVLDSQLNCKVVVHYIRSTLANYFTIHNEVARAPPAAADKEGDNRDYFEEDNQRWHQGKKSQDENEGRDIAGWLTSSQVAM